MVSVAVARPRVAHASTHARERRQRASGARRSNAPRAFLASSTAVHANDASSCAMLKRASWRGKYALNVRASSTSSASEVADRNGADGGGEANGSATTGAGTSFTALDDSFRGLEGTEWFSRDFSESGRRFSEVFPVRFAEVGSNGEATMVTIADLIQECACNHAQGIWGVGQSMPAEMARANLAWVCTRLHLRDDELLQIAYLRKIFQIDDSEHRAIARSMDRQLEEVVHRTLKDEVRIRLYDSIDRMGDIFDNILVKNEDRK